MKFQIKRGRRSTTVRFKAETDQDGKDLKDAVIVAAKTNFSPAGIVEELQRIWEERKTEGGEQS